MAYTAIFEGKAAAEHLETLKKALLLLAQNSRRNPVEKMLALL